MKRKRIITVVVTAAAVINGVCSANPTEAPEHIQKEARGGITIHASSRPATEVFDEIMRQSGMNFIYTSGLLDGVRVSVNATGAPLKTVLSDMFRGTGIDFRIKGRNILLSKRQAPEKKTVRHTISGFVREEGSGEALAGALVSAPGIKAGTYTNAMGFYSLSLPSSPCTLRISYPGYATDTVAGFMPDADRSIDFSLRPDAESLQEVVVDGSRNRTLAMESAQVGGVHLGKADILATPVIFGESDVIKTLQYEPGVSAGVEGMAGMYVHGGNADENLYMLDNVPLYQVNHFGGLFSAFNTEALRSVDFHKSSFPSKFDGRLSSYMEVHTKDGSMTEHHGSAKLGLTSGAFNIDGPIWKNHTSYSVALRRSWYDVLTIPALAIFNSISKHDDYGFGYAFTDINAKINHRFSDRSRAYIMFYYGEDYLRVTETSGKNQEDFSMSEKKSKLRWGNTVASAGWNYVFSPTLFGEITGAYTRYGATLRHSRKDGYNEGGNLTGVTGNSLSSDNKIHDWIMKADFDWRPHPAHHLEFGAGYTFHSFLPSRTRHTLVSEEMSSVVEDRIDNYRAGELNAYFGGDWRPSDALRIDYGAHYSIFSIDGKNHSGLSPRLSVRWRPADNWVVKGGYSRTTQYVHQLIQSSISLPTDQWVPIAGDCKPQTADKVFAGVYHTFGTGFTASIEAYWKKMHNLLKYADEYYLIPPTAEWTARMASGKGTAKGLDFKLQKDFGPITGHLAYSLMWADRQYADKNGGRPFPARFDNRHKINVMVNWKINSKWEVSAAWTGMSGNRITLPTQCWEDPMLAPWHYDMDLPTEVNNYRLPFFHRLDLNFRRNTKRGYWDFSLYNAYCNMNTIAVRRDYSDEYIYGSNFGDWHMKRVFQKIKLIPIIPSVSYTWLF